MTFHKYHGTGNDFILLDDRAAAFDATDHEKIAALCHRHFGIGADGLMLLRDRADYDFEMLYFNADGRPGSLCGNGSRCVVAFAKHLGLVEDKAHFRAADGPHDAQIDSDGTVHLKIQNVAPARPAPVHAQLGDVYLHTGSPHHVRFLAQATHDEHDYDHPHLLDELNVISVGNDIRHDQAYDPVGTNVNFAEIPADPAQPWPIRTFERGVEDETLSCGTGAVAVALAAVAHGATSPVRLHTLGGELQVRFENQADGSFADVWLSGPAVRVYGGEV